MMLRTLGQKALESNDHGSSGEPRGRVVSMNRVRAPGLQRSRIDQLETELDAARRALAVAKSAIIAMQSAERSARYLAMHDELTSLPNHRFFCQRLAQAMTGARGSQPSLAVLYFDLDGFKQLNDTHGHHVGNELLRIIGSRLSRAVRAEDFVSRLGGDEFACLIDGTPIRSQLATLADQLYDVVKAPLRIAGLDLAVRASIGIAIAPRDGDSADDLMQHADCAMYRAKRRGTGREFYNSEDG
jgi:diguanylate cyclase (GGDEF)-like protein